MPSRNCLSPVSSSNIYVGLNIKERIGLFLKQKNNKRGKKVWVTPNFQGDYVTMAKF